MTIVDSDVTRSRLLEGELPVTVTGGQALTAALTAALIDGGVDTLIAIPGIQLDGFFNAVWEERDHLRMINTRHEQATAYSANSPVLCVTGQSQICTRR